MNSEWGSVRLSPEEIASLFGRKLHISGRAYKINCLGPNHPDLNPSMMIFRVDRGSTFKCLAYKCDKQTLKSIIESASQSMPGSYKLQKNPVIQQIRQESSLSPHKFITPITMDFSRLIAGSTGLWIYRDKNNQPYCLVTRFNKRIEIPGNIPPGNPEDQEPESIFSERKADNTSLAIQDKEIRPISCWKLGSGPALIKKSPPVPLLLYNLHHILCKNQNIPLVLLEGEKTAEAAQYLFPDTICTSFMGQKNAQSTDISPLFQRKITIIYEKDESGIRKEEQLYQDLSKITRYPVQSIDISTWLPMLPGEIKPRLLKFDLADAMGFGYTPQMITKLRRALPKNGYYLGI